jgi:hypothetical protein
MVPAIQMRRVNTGRECGMLEAPDDFRILFLGEVTQVSLRFKITKRIEYHGLASRR